MVPEHDAAVTTGCDKCRRLGRVETYVVDAVNVVDAVGRCAVAAEFEVSFAVLGTRQSERPFSPFSPFPSLPLFLSQPPCGLRESQLTFPQPGSPH